ncbi:lipoyl domain-containing protein [bacterium]|nr:lipoyl domain-containing protein [bacterium]MBU1024608.1 lipoyl domain-containing protein [bacterium]
MKKVTFDIVIPRLSDEIIDCQIVRWMKDIGEYVIEGDILVELETEKTTIEIETPTAGILEDIYVFEGEEVIENERIGIINCTDTFDEDDIELLQDENQILANLKIYDEFDDESDEVDDLSDELDEYEDTEEKIPAYQIDMDDDPF